MWELIKNMIHDGLFQAGKDLLKDQIGIYIAEIQQKKKDEEGE